MQQPATPPKGIASDDELIRLHSRLMEAEEARLNRETGKAITICRELLAKHPDYVGALQTLGLILADKGEPDNALGFLNQALMLNPKDWKILTAISGVYLQLGATALAAQTLERAQQLNPGEASILVTLGEMYREEREYELAADCHEKAYELDKNLHDALVGFGLSCTHLGRYKEAADAFKTHLAAEPSDFQTLFSLSQLPANSINLDILARLNEAETRGNRTEEFESAFAFAKSAAFDKAKRHADAWRELVPANRSIWLANREEYLGDAQTRREFLNYIRDYPASPFGDASDVPGPISLFILGPSRSGKTTIENILSGFPGVKRGYENPLIENSVRRTFQTAGLVTRDRLVELPQGLDHLFREFYLADLNERAASAAIFTNTHPGRIFDVMRLANAIPRTRFLFVKRDIDDIMVRIFMKRYNAGHYYSYNLGSTREYVEWYYYMIDTCTQKLPQICRVVNYEDIFENPQNIAKAVAELCGLPADAEKFRAPADDRGASLPYREMVKETLAS